MAAKSETTRLPVRLELDPADHRDLRVAAALAQKPMSIFVREAVLEAIRAAKKNLEKSTKSR